MLKNYNNYIKENKSINQVYIGQGYNDIKNEIIKLDGCDYYCQIKNNNKYITIGSIELCPYNYKYDYSYYNNKKNNIELLLLNSFEIKEKFRNKGYGEKFLKLLIDKLKDWKIEYLILNVAPNNDIAFNLYKKLGFEKVIDVKDFPYKYLGSGYFNPNRWMVKKMKDGNQLKESLLDKIEGPSEEDIRNYKYNKFLEGKIRFGEYYEYCKENEFDFPSPEIAYEKLNTISNMIDVANKYLITEYLIYIRDVKGVRLNQILDLNRRCFHYELEKELPEKTQEYYNILKESGCGKNNLSGWDIGFINKKLYKASSTSYINICKICDEPTVMRYLNQMQDDFMLCECEKCKNYVVVNKSQWWYYSKY